MIHSIQRFTTQHIPPAVIAGLEPKRAEPRPAPARFAPSNSRRPGPGAKRPSFGGAPSRWADARGAKPRSAR
jgi:hypothetical protein